MNQDSLQNQYNKRLEAEIREYERKKQEERKAMKKKEETSDQNHQDSPS
jgi:hypothetical protein